MGRRLPFTMPDHDIAVMYEWLEQLGADEDLDNPEVKDLSIVALKSLHERVKKLESEGGGDE